MKDILQNLRFPLIIFVIFLHVFSGMHTIDIYNGITNDIFLRWLSLIVSPSAVPLFFFISGYLFFLNMPKWHGGIL